MASFHDVVEFHGHTCPGLAIGYRVSLIALKEFGKRSEDEELVAIVENNSCAVDAVQVMTGCTFGKGNLIFKDYGKQVYTFIKRPSGDALRVSVDWKTPEETPEEKAMWERYMKGEQSSEVLKVVHDRKSRKIKSVLEAKDDEILKIEMLRMELPEEAHIYPSIRCEMCGEKVMEPRARVKEGKIVCIPCSERQN